MNKRKLWKALLLIVGVTGLFGSAGCASSGQKDQSAGQPGATEIQSSGSAMQKQSGTRTTQKRNPDL